MNDKYSISWRGPSSCSADSMPLGGYDMGCNIWVENGQLRAYACQSGAYDENGTLLKLGRIRMALDGLALGDGMTQTLYPTEGVMEIAEGDDRITLWCDTDKAELHIDYCGAPRKAKVWFDCWRYRDREIPKEQFGQCRELMIFGGGSTLADSVTAADGEILARHANGPDTVYAKMIAQQRMEELRGLYVDRLGGLTSGGLLRAPGMKSLGSEDGEYAGVDFRSWVLGGDEPRAEWHVTLTALCTQQPDWERLLREAADRPSDIARTRAWWNERFGRSYIDIDPGRPGTQGWRIARNYALFRYMSLCNHAGAYPTKFNGGLFTFDEGRTPDYRNWGGITFTAQNQRHVYWPLLRSGDFDAMTPQFDFYRNITAARKELIRRSCGHGGATFDEHPSIFGMCCSAEYESPSKGRRAEVPWHEVDNPWVRLEYSSAPEFALMILLWERHCGGDIAPYLDFIDSSIRFYFEHYPRTDEGRLRIFPSTALETYKGPDPYSADAEQYGVADPMDAVAALRAVLDLLIARGGEHADEYRAWRAICPELPTGERDGYRVFRPAAEYTMPPFNCELPQLYRVFPYSPDGLTAEEIELGRNTWYHNIDTEAQHWHQSWHQNGIFATRLCLMDEALDYLGRKLGDCDHRFPAFWGPGHDWSPDHNWGGSGSVQLQEMLMRADGDQLVLFPCWPREWDARFRMFGPGGVTVEAEMVGGKARVIEVTPASAAGRVRIAE